MTLLLAARGAEHIVLLSDGLSLRQVGSDLSVDRDELLKQFPIDGVSAVIAHHGQNQLGSVSVEQALSSAAYRRAIEASWPSGLNHVLAQSIVQLDTAVCQTLESAPPRIAFGLWFAGFWTCTDRPDIAELMWRKTGPSQTRVHCQPLGDLSIGGSGYELISEFLGGKLGDKFHYSKIMRNPPEYSMEYLKALYREALKRQAGRTNSEQVPIFGGQATMSLITRDGVDIGPVDLSAAN